MCTFLMLLTLQAWHGIRFVSKYDYRRPNTLKSIKNVFSHFSFCLLFLYLYLSFYFLLSLSGFQSRLLHVWMMMLIGWPNQSGIEINHIGFGRMFDWGLINLHAPVNALQRRLFLSLHLKLPLIVRIVSHAGQQHPSTPGHCDQIECLIQSIFIFLISCRRKVNFSSILCHFGFVSLSSWSLHCEFSTQHYRSFTHILFFVSNDNSTKCTSVVAKRFCCRLHSESWRS